MFSRVSAIFAVIPTRFWKLNLKQFCLGNLTQSIYIISVIRKVSAVQFLVAKVLPRINAFTQESSCPLMYRLIFPSRSSFYISFRCCRDRGRCGMAYRIWLRLWVSPLHQTSSSGFSVHCAPPVSCPDPT